MKRTLLLPAFAVTLLAASCSSDGPDADTGSVPPPATEPDTTTTADRNEPAATGREPGVTTGDEPAGSDPGDAGMRPLAFAPAALTQFGECPALLDHIKTQALDRVGPYGLDGVGYGGPVFDVAAADDGAREVAAEEPASEPDAAPAATESPRVQADDAAQESSGSGEPGGDVDDSGDGTFSTTNVQVEGVDEPDIVKTDGNRVLAITGEQLHYIDISEDGTTGTKRGSLRLSDPDGTLEGGSGGDAARVSTYSSSHEIFVAGDRAFVFANAEVYFDGPFPQPFPEPRPVDDIVSVDEPAVVTEGSTEGSEGSERTESSEVTEADADAEAGLAPDAPPADEPIPVEPEVMPPIRPEGYFGPQTVVFDIDLTNPDDLRIVNTVTIDGRYVSARSIGDTARLVVSSPPAQLDFLYPSGPATEDAATEANRNVIAGTTIEDWLPTFTFEGNGGVSTGALVPCENVFVPSNFGGFDILSIVTLDLGGPLAPPSGTSTVMASGDTVYASEDRMYVSTNLWNPIVDEATREWLGENYETAIHRFSIAGDQFARYEGSGTVEGHLLNQFSMNDRDGTFYVATTKGAPWNAEDTSESQIVAMQLDGDRLVQVGSVGGLGLGERIFSVRYVGDLAYVVTFRQVDPFYVVAIGDPTAMAVLGELKIPGFSSYLHPISDTLVVGVGQDASEQGFTTGTKVSLFDVSNPSNPLEVDVWTLPDAYSDAEFDHRAFLYWPDTSTAVLPLQSWSDRFAGAVVLQITADGIVEQGRITHQDGEDGPVGVTDCRVITAEELGATDDGSEFVWITQDGGQIQACTAEQAGGATGLFCDPIPVGDLQYWVPNPDQLTIDLTGIDRIEVCWPDWNGWQLAVMRTMVIDGTLWTLSQGRLQANDLATLDRTAAVAL